MGEQRRAGAVPWRRGRGRRPWRGQGRGPWLTRSLATAALLLAALAVLASIAPALPVELSWGLGLVLLLCR